MRPQNILYFVIILVFLYFFLIFDVNFYGPDEPIYFAYTASIVEDGDLNIVNQAYYDYGRFVSQTYNLPKRHTHGGIILWAPFYIYGKSIYYLGSKIGFTMEGLMPITKCAMSFSTIVFSFLVIIFTYLLCRIFFSNKIIFWSLAVIFFGTPFFYYALFETGNAHIIASLFSVILIWFSSKMISMKKKEWLLYGLFFSICVAVKNDLWPSILFIVIYFTFLCIFKKMRWRNGVYFLIGFAIIFTLRIINNYLKYGVLRTEESIRLAPIFYLSPQSPIKFANLFSLCHNIFSNFKFPGLFNSFRGIFYTSPILYICVLGFIFALIDLLKNFKNKNIINCLREKSQGIFFFIILPSCFWLKLYLQRGLSSAGDSLTARLFLTEFPIFVLLFAQVLQKKYFRYMILAISLFLVLWNLLIISEFMTGLDWVYIAGAPTIIERMPTLKYIFYVLLHIKDMGLKLKTCLLLIPLVLYASFYILKRFAVFSRILFRLNRDRGSGRYLFKLLYLFTVYCFIIYTIFTMLNIFNNRRNVEKLKVAGFFKDARITEIHPLKMPEDEIEEGLWMLFKNEAYAALKGDRDMFKNIRQGVFGKRERVRLHQLPLKPYNELISFFTTTGKYKKAIDCYQDIIRMDPSDFGAYISLGDIYAAIGEYDRAIECFKQALSINPNISKLYICIGDIYDKIGKPEQAIEFFKKAILSNPTLFAAHLGLGNIYNIQGNFDEAIECFKQAMQLNPNSTDAYLNLGSIYNTKGDYDKAIECFKQVLKLNPNFADAYISLGYIYNSQGNYEKAVECFKQTLKLNPNFADAHLILGNIYSAQDNYPKAIEYLNKAIQLKPNSADVYSNLGNIYSAQGNYPKAIEYYQKAAELNPFAFDTYSNLGNLYSNRGQYDKAIESFEKALQLNPNNAGVYRNLGDIYLKKGDIKNVLRQIKKLRELKKNDLADELEQSIRK